LVAFVATVLAESILKLPAEASTVTAPANAPTAKLIEGVVDEIVAPPVMSSASPVPPWDGPTPALAVAVMVTLPAVPVPTVLALMDAPEIRTDGPLIAMLPALPGSKPKAGAKPVVMLPPSIKTA
jgi:hypothetical protein